MSVRCLVSLIFAGHHVFHQPYLSTLVPILHNNYILAKVSCIIWTAGESMNLLGFLISPPWRTSLTMAMTMISHAQPIRFFYTAGQNSAASASHRLCRTPSVLA